MSTAVLTHFAPAAAGRPVARKAGLLARLFAAFQRSRMQSAANELARRGIYVNETKVLLDEIRNVSLASDAKLPFAR